ncbi:hypothetical protein, partial [Mesorhizobium sp. B2-4-10]|uniref:hypothetical protein n=1 Tax=Mesorhizobium sp. B2-4-10 TaxID=2589939 RepID=UPI001AEDB219
VNRFDAKTEADRSCATKPDNLISYRHVFGNAFLETRVDLAATPGADRSRIGTKWCREYVWVQKDKTRRTRSGGFGTGDEQASAAALLCDPALRRGGS